MRDSCCAIYEYEFKFKFYSNQEPTTAKAEYLSEADAPWDKVQTAVLAFAVI